MMHLWTAAITKNVSIFSKKKTDIFTCYIFNLWWDFQKLWPIMQPTNNMTVNISGEQ